MTKKVCEKKSHERLAWLLAGVFMAGMASAWALGGTAGWAIMGFPTLLGLLSMGVYSGFIKLEGPRKKPTGSIEPKPLDPKP